MKKFVCAVFFAVVSVSSHAGLTVTSSIGEVEITTVTGTPENLFDLLESQPWFTGDPADFALALEFAGLVDQAFGLPNTGFTVSGPNFVFNGMPSDFSAAALAIVTVDPELSILTTVGPVDAVRTFAVAVMPTAVSEPSAVFLLGMGLLAFSCLRAKSRTRCAKNAHKSAQDSQFASA